MLAEMVQKGTIPPVDQRLPAEPVVLKPLESIGVYGGTWRDVIRRANESMYAELYYEPMLRFAMGGEEVIPNVADSWEVDEEAKVFTFHMHQGIRWSDGEPLTADDVVFWFEDMVSNTELFPAFPTWMAAGGKGPTLEKLDDYTVRFTFETSAPFFIRQMGHPWHEPYRPQHFLQQFHKKYADAAELDAKIKDSGFNTWVELFLAKESWDTSLDVPVIFAWMNETLEPDQRTAVRNPYYWKVDSEGNQLPYIDKQTSRMANDTSTAQLMAFSGEVDYSSFAIGQFPRDTMALKQNMDTGNYHVVDAPISEPNVLILGLNLNHKDPILRELFNDRRFRIAVSHSINREEIRKLIYLDQPKESRQVAPLPASPWYHEAAAKNYTEFDPAKSNNLFDELGLTERDGSGFRLRSDGQPLSITFEVMSFRDDFIDALELIAGWLQKAGINASVKPQEISLYNTRIAAAEHDAGVHFSGNGYLPITDMSRMIPVVPGCLWAPAWGAWYGTKGASGEEPPAQVKKQMELYDQILLTPAQEDQLALWKQLMDVHAEEMYHLGICDRATVPCTVSNRMHNLPKTGWNNAWELGTVASTYTYQWYIQE